MFFHCKKLRPPNHKSHLMGNITCVANRIFVVRRFCTPNTQWLNAWYIPRNLQQDLLNGPLNLSIYSNSSNLLKGPLVRSHSICDGYICQPPMTDPCMIYWDPWNFSPTKINHSCRYSKYSIHWVDLGKKPKSEPEGSLKIFFLATKRNPSNPNRKKLSNILEPQNIQL